MSRKRSVFMKQVDRLLRQVGLSFQGVHLRCRSCGDEALAKDTACAREWGGWTKLRHLRGPHYSGLCIDCSKREPRKRKMP
jgi:hypothetical protein